jgi:SAM-dependent methyltransferase
MNGVFGKDYANVYDALYDAKDYAGEVALIERILLQHGAKGPRRLLDFGCGTGNHALPLACHGHTVVGVDSSASMLAHARAKVFAALSDITKRPEFYEGDIRSIDLGERFDVALMMFNVLGYLYEDVDLIAALKTVRRHLENGGLFIFDVWNGLGVLADKPVARSMTATDGSARIIRKTRVQLDAPRHLCHVYFDLERVDALGKSARWTEEHVVRFYFPQELKRVLRDHGLGLLQLRRFPDNEGPPDEKAWNVIGVAQAQ